jgi:excisionase family DNA binding protein
MAPLTLADLDTLRTYDEVAERLSVSPRTVARLVNDGELGVVKIGSGRGHPRVPERAIVDYLNRRYRRADRKPGTDDR